MVSDAYSYTNNLKFVRKSEQLITSSLSEHTLKGIIVIFQSSQGQCHKFKILMHEKLCYFLASYDMQHGPEMLLDVLCDFLDFFHG